MLIVSYKYTTKEYYTPILIKEVNTFFLFNFLGSAPDTAVRVGLSALSRCTIRMPAPIPHSFLLLTSTHSKQSK